jgi:cyclase
MKLHFGLALALCSWAVTLPASAQQDFSAVEIKATLVAKNIYMLEGSVGSDGLLMVDNQFAPLAGKIEAALKTLGPGKLKFILNTHFHGDHTGGNAHFGQQAPIIAQTNVRRRLGRGAGEALPVITFDQSLSLHFNGEEIKMVHVGPGHTDSDSIILFTGANVVHTGDSFFCGRFPNIDLGGGGDVRGFIKNVEEMISKIPADAKIIPGHGPLANLDDMKKFHVMLQESAAIVERALQAGKTLEQIKAEGLPEKFKSWEAKTLNTSRWLEILHAGLSKKP